MSSFQVIDGNIKQQIMPFVLEPDATLNQAGGNFKIKGKADPQYFTYKNNSRYMWSGKAQLNFCPNSVKNAFDTDIGNKMLFSSSGNSKESVTFQQILNDIPGVQIREFIPDSALDQTIQLFTQIIQSVMSLFKKNGVSFDTSVEKQKTTIDANGKETTTKLNDVEIAAAEEQKQTIIFNKLRNIIKVVMEYVSGNNTSGKNIIDQMSAGYSSNTMPMKGIYNDNDKKPNNIHKKILDFPYILYYQLQSCTTTNIYEVPAIKQDNIMYSSDGTHGWGEDGFKLINKTTSSLPIFGKLLSRSLGSIGISWMPYWDPIDGVMTSEPDVSIEFDLFNDTKEATISNFIFVNTLIANNKYIQYGMFQSSGSIYDIKLEGYNRLFACKGKFEVKKNGVLRLPPKCFFDTNRQDNPLSKYINKNINFETFVTSLKKDKSLMIPDIYHVKMDFSSLLPANFNQYLYTLVANKDPIETYYTHVYDETKAVTGLTNIIKGLVDNVKNEWNKK